MRRPWLLWTILAALYLGFRLWYDGGGGPLRPEEIAHYMATLEERGADPTRLQAIREFLEADTGSDFVMANFIQLRDEPSARAELDRYMDGILSPLVWRACHPVLAGPVVGRPLDLWGLENADHWSLVALVRYRSRRDMIEIATDPRFQEAHPHKVAALERTIAIPTEPFLQLGSPRWLAALALALPGALLQLALRRRAR